MELTLLKVVLHNTKLYLEFTVLSVTAGGCATKHD
jgi:hypothetical protein